MILLDTHIWVRWVDPQANPLSSGIIERIETAILLIPLLAAGVLLANLFGWLLARILPTDDFMPLGYRLICTKIA